MTYHYTYDAGDATVLEDISKRIPARVTHLTVKGDELTKIGDYFLAGCNRLLFNKFRYGVVR